MPLGYRVYTRVERPDPDLVRALATHATPDLADAMNRANTLDPAIRSIFGPIPRVAGPAVTVAIPTGALSVLKEAVERTAPGDVLVVNACGNPTAAVIGGNICRGMVHRGVAGLVVDGALRDVSEIRADGLPSFARHVATFAGPKDGPGEVNVPVACGGVVVNPGDIVVADEDGIVVVPPERAAEVLERVARVEAGFAAAQEVLLRGGVTGIADIEAAMRAEGCEFVDGAWPR
ncbi:MAG TPA: hypothetical protein VFN57_09885 [Thermomicrobiaceae bacterium]|nr:hypothetical protein [Thermomicrobiaceae bacterium]